jgi:hypothetical protein
MAHNYDDLAVITDGATDYFRLDTQVDEAVNKAKPTMTISTSGAGSAHDLLPATNNLHSNYFDGSDDFAIIDTAGYHDYTNKLTIECWFRADSDMSGDEFAGLVVKNGSFGLCLHYGKPAFFIFTDGNANPAELASSTAVSAGDTHHLVGIYDATEPHMALYIDGAFYGDSTSYSGELVQNSSGLCIGSWDTSVLFFNGWISNVALYDEPLSGGQVYDHYTYAG